MEKGSNIESLLQVAGLEEDSEKMVPSKSDVLDILNTASFGSNVVNSDNLKQVYVKYVGLLLQVEPLNNGHRGDQPLCPLLRGCPFLRG